MAYAIDLWKIVLNSNCSEETRINIKNGLDELNAKARAFDGIINIKYDFVNYHGLYPSDEDYIKELEDIIRKYMEDK